MSSFGCNYSRFLEKQHPLWLRQATSEHKSAAALTGVSFQRARRSFRVWGGEIDRVKPLLVSIHVFMAILFAWKTKLCLSSFSMLEQGGIKKQGQHLEQRRKNEIFFRLQNYFHTIKHVSLPLLLSLSPCNKATHI